MKILYIVPFVPWPVRVRSFNLIPRLARHHELYLVCVTGVEPGVEQTAWLRRYCKQTIHVPHSKWKGLMQCAAALPTKTPLRIAYCRSNSAQEKVLQFYNHVQPDIIYVERWRALQYVPRDVKAPLVCDPTDSMTLYNERLMQGGSWWEKLVGWEEYIKFLKFEGELARLSNVSVFCSILDMQYVKRQAPEVDCQLVPNAVDCEKYFFKEESEEEAATIIFTGSFKYRPNFHAVKFFIDKIFPQVEQEVPGVKFLAVGNGASHALRSYQHRAGFQSIDFVPELRMYLARASVAVAPLTIGSGVSNKLIEGFAVGTPVVATPLACGDLSVRSGEHLLIGRDAQEFAEHVVNLLRDAHLRRQMAKRARQFVEEEYDWEIASSKMQLLMEKLVGIETTEKAKEAFATS